MNWSMMSIRMWNDNYEPSEKEKAIYGNMPEVQRLERHLNALAQAMELLEDDYLGGQGSRGYGKVKFGNPQLEYKKITAAGYTKVNETDKPAAVANFEAKLKAQ